MPQIEELTLDDLMELASFAFPARVAGVPKVQMDSAHAVSLIALAAKSHRQDALIASRAARIRELEERLAELEQANEIVATIRSMQTYEAMIRDQGASSALIRLDDARRRARAALRAKGGEHGE